MDSSASALLLKAVQVKELFFVQILMQVLVLQSALVCLWLVV